MSEALLCASTTATLRSPVWICMKAVASPWRPSPEIVQVGRSAAPSWSGTNSSKIPKPS